MSSQFVMTLNSKRPKSALPLAFTEHGVAMLANILKSKKARRTSVSIVRSFIALKQYALSHQELTKQLKTLEHKYDKQFEDIYEAINYLIQKNTQETEQKTGRRIGYKE